MGFLSFLFDFNQATTAAPTAATMTPITPAAAVGIAQEPEEEAAREEIELIGPPPPEEAGTEVAEDTAAEAATLPDLSCQILGDRIWKKETHANLEDE